MPRGSSEQCCSPGVICYIGLVSFAGAVYVMLIMNIKKNCVLSILSSCKCSWENLNRGCAVLFSISDYVHVPKTYLR